MRRVIFALGVLFLFTTCKKEVPQKQLTVNVTPEVGGSATPSTGTYAMGSTVKVLATPSAEYIFKEWTGGFTGTTNPANVIMDADKTISAVFEKREYPLGLTIVGSGTVKEEIIKIASLANNYKSGTTVRLTPQPSEGYEFKRWSGDDTTSKSPLDLIVSKATNLTCTFEKEEAIKFSTNLDTGTYNVFDTLPLVITVSSKLPKAGIVYSILVNWTDSTKQIFKLDSTSSQSSLSLKIPGLKKVGNYSVLVSLTSKSTNSNTANKTLNVKYKSNLNVYLLNIDSIRIKLGISKKGELSGSNNLGWIIVDMNNDGLEDIFYPYSSAFPNKLKPDVLINKGDHFEVDNNMLPSNFDGTLITRKTVTSDFNRDGLPDLFLINHGWDQAPFIGESNTLLLSNKNTMKYEIGILPVIEKSFWHGGDAGDLNGDGNADVLIINAGQGADGKHFILYGDGKGNFNAIEWYFNKPGGGCLTGKICDVDKDGKNDIIILGGEIGTPGSTSLKSTIYFNTNNTFSNQLVICEPNTDGWGLIMDVICADLDNDGTNEIILDRTGDQSNYWYSGYNITFYKSTDRYKSFSDVTSRFIVNGNTAKGPKLDWMKRITLLNIDNMLLIRGNYGADGIKTWFQDSNSKVFK